MRYPLSSILLGLVFGVGVASAQSWNGTNNPYNMNPNYQYHLDSLPSSGTVDQKQMPWSDNYWESDWGGISFRWMSVSEIQRDPDEREWVDKYSFFQYTPPTKEQVLKMSKEDLKKLSPAEKYDILMSRYDYPTVKSERERTGPWYDDWQGICHGWVPASINHAEPLPNEATNADGVVVPFGSADIKGLLSYYYGVPAYDYARGNRAVIRVGGSMQYLDQVDTFDLAKWLAVPPNAYVFNYDTGYEIGAGSLDDTQNCLQSEYLARYGTVEKCKKALSVNGTVDVLNLVGQIGSRPTKKSRTLRDPNAGAFHVVMANQLGLMKQAFVGNINKKIKNMEIWNQPIVGYQSSISSGRRGKVRVTTKLIYVTEIPQTWEPVVGTAKQRFADMTFGYTLDLDRYGNITGGEWDDDRYHPSFAWNHGKLEIKGYFQKLNEIYQSK